MAEQRHSAAGGGGQRWRAVGALARRQHGIVSRPQLRALGFRPGAIDRAIAQGRLYPLFRGAFGVGHPPQGRNAKLVAAVLACGEGSVISHGTAAALLGLWRCPPRLIDVIALVEAGRKIDGVYRRHTPFPSEREAWVHEGVPCTSPSRTIVDVAGIANERTLRETIEQAAVLRMLNVPEIDAVLDGPRRRGSRRLRLIVDLWRRYPPGMCVRSRLEAKLLPLLTEYGLEIPRVNQKLAVGSERFEIDFLWPRHRLVVETDGGRYHDNPEAKARDRHRNRLLHAAGYRVWRLSWDDLAHRPEATLLRLSSLLRGRAPNVGGTAVSPLP